METRLAVERKEEKSAKHIMLASMRAKVKSAFDADTMDKVTINKRHINMPSRDAIIGWHEMPS